MSTQIPSQYILQYQDEMRLAYQFRGSKLRDKIKNATHMGQGASPADYVGPMLANVNPGRLAATPTNNAAVTRRWVYPNYFDNAVQIAKQDVTRVFNGGQLQTGYAEAQALAMGRQVDDFILASFFATATTGINAGSTESFPAGNVIADTFGLAAAGGLTVAKLIEGKRILQAGAVDIENTKLWMALHSSDHSALLKQIEIRSQEFAGKYNLVDGYLMNFLGINFVHIDFTNSTYYPLSAVANVSGSDRLVPLWAEDSVHLGEWRPVEVNGSWRPDLSYAWQMYTFGEVGATRLQSAGVVQIKVTTASS